MKKEDKKMPKKQLSEREKELREMAKKVQNIIKKHNVKPFDRKEVYGYL